MDITHKHTSKASVDMHIFFIMAYAGHQKLIQPHLTTFNNVNFNKERNMRFVFRVYKKNGQLVQIVQLIKISNSLHRIF